jgi:hypothetical protein
MFREPIDAQKGIVYPKAERQEPLPVCVRNGQRAPHAGLTSCLHRAAGPSMVAFRTGKMRMCRRYERAAPEEPSIDIDMHTGPGSHSRAALVAGGRSGEPRKVSCPAGGSWQPRHVGASAPRLTPADGATRREAGSWRSRDRLRVLWAARAKHVLTRAAPVGGEQPWSETSVAMHRTASRDARDPCMHACPAGPALVVVLGDNFPCTRDLGRVRTAIDRYRSISMPSVLLSARAIALGMWSPITVNVVGSPH